MECRYRCADKSLAWPGRKQANVSVRMAWISFSAFPCRKKRKLDDSSHLDVVEIAHVPDMLPSLFPSWSGSGLISTLICLHRLLSPVLYGSGWSAFCHGHFICNAHCIWGWVGPRISLDTLEKRKVSYSYEELRYDSWGILSMSSGSAACCPKLG